MMPNAKFYLFAVVPVPAWAFVTGIFLCDGYSALHDQVCNVLLAAKKSAVLMSFMLQREGTDTAGHVGGLLAGVAYYLRLRFRLR